MSSVSKCPRCQQPVTIPDAVAAEAVVRCPLCIAEYPLGEALTGVPPTLIVVEAAAVVTTAGKAVAMGSMVEIPPLPPPLAPPVAENAVELPTEVVQAEAGHEVEYLSHAEAEAEKGDAMADETETFDASAFAGLRKEPAGGEGKEPPSGVPRWRTRRKAKKRNPVKELIGVVLGGFVGLLIGYYLLNWIGGPRFNFLDFDLPFLPSKQSSKPETKNDNAGSWVSDQRGPFDRFAV